MLYKLKALIKIISSDKRLRLISIGVLIIILSLIFGKMKVDKPRTEIQTPIIYKETSATAVNIWRGVIPGATKFSDIKDKFGEQVFKKPFFNDLYVYTFTPEDTILRKREVGVDRYNIVRFIYDPVSYKKGQKAEVIIQNLDLGQPDLIKYDKVRLDEKLYVFLSKGIMLSEDTTNNSVYAILYFAPMSRESFIYMWGARMTDEQLHYNSRPQDVK